MLHIEIKHSTVLLLALVLILFGSQYVFSFTEPTQTPPLDNVAAPFAPPTGTILMFDLTSCPSGWTRYTTADGRTVVGAGSSIGSQIGSALSNQENRTVGYHNHGIYDPSHAHGVYDPTHSHGYSSSYSFGHMVWSDGPAGMYGGWTSTGAAATGISIYGAGTGIQTYAAGSISGTNAPYVQLLMCRKS